MRLEPRLEPTTAQRIREVQEQRGMTIADLARATGLTHSRISMMYTRDTEPRRDALARIAQALQVEPAYLRTGLNPPSALSPSPSPAPSPAPSGGGPRSLAALPQIPFYDFQRVSAGDGSTLIYDDPIESGPSPPI